MFNGSLSASNRHAGSSPFITPNSQDARVAAARAHHSAQAFLTRNQPQNAVSYFAEAIRLDPSNAGYHLAYGACMAQMGERDLAHESYLTAQKLDPNLAAAHRLLSQWYLSEGMIDDALACSAKAIELAPHDHGTAAVRADILEFAGESDAAWEIVQKLISEGFLLPMVVVMYARMSRRRGHEGHALAMLGLLLQSGSHSPMTMSVLRFAAAEMLDGMGRYDEAFIQATAANTLRRPPYFPAEHERTVQRMINYFTEERVAALPKATYRSSKPVFIVGMPRSGTSLVEQILASHPSVHGAGELDFMSRVFGGAISMLSATADDFPECLDRLNVDMANGLAQVYVEPLSAMNRSALRITDKLPLNFLHLGLISLLLPDAHIIHCRRDPMDNCLSCYMTDITMANDYKYDLGHLGHFYRLHDRLMDHWKSVLNIPILVMNYEQMIAEPEQESRRLVEFIGLPWDAACLEFHKNKRPVITASNDQVRRPIYNTSVERWRHYEKHLGPLKQALGLA